VKEGVAGGQAGWRGLGGLFALLLVGLLLRVWLATTQSAWIDEAYSLQTMARLPLSAIAHAVQVQDVHPPLYYQILHLWLAVVGFGVFQARLLSVLAGVATIPVLYVLAARLTDRRTAIGAALLLTFSPIAVWYADEARMYALTGLCGLLAVLCFRLAAQEGGSRWRWWVGYAVAAALAVSFDSSGLYLPLAANLYYVHRVARRSASIGPWLASNALALALSIPAVQVIRAQVANNLSTVEWIGAPTFGTVWKALLTMLCMNADLMAVGLIFALLAIPAAIALGRSFAGEDRTDESVFLVLITVTPILAPLALGALTGHPIFLFRTAQTAVYGLLILFSRGLVLLLRYRATAGLLACVAVGALYFSSLHAAASYTLKEDWRGLDASLARQEGAAGVIAVDPCWLQPAFSLYLPSRHLPLRLLGCNPPNSLVLSATALGGYRSVWLVSGYQGGSVPHDATLRFLDTRYRRLSSVTLTGGLILRHYQR
jgi:4-amino-4-deoxy-L-arabinose transferase-like glycosyltransferase